MRAPHEIKILEVERRYFYVTAAQVRDAVAPGKDKDTSTTRTYLRALERDGLTRRHQPRLLPPGVKSVPDIWVLTCKGSSVLTAATGDVKDLLLVEPNFSDWMSLNHYTAMAGLHMAFDRAVAAQSYVKTHDLIYEHEVQDASQREPARRFRLYQAFPGSPVVCVPDSAIEVELGSGRRRVLFFEREMGSDTPARVAHKKSKGYAMLHQTGLFRTNFPQAQDFRAVAVCPNRGWAELLMQQMKDRPGAGLWLYAAAEDVLDDTKVLHAPVFRQWKKGDLGLVDSGPIPLITPPPGGTTGLTTGVALAT